MVYQFEPSGKLKILTEQELAVSEGDSAIIVYHEGILEDGSPYWVYVAVKPSKYKAFTDKASRKEVIEYNQYGEIIQYGFDTVVPESIKELMKREYGCDDKFMDVLVADFKAAQASFLKEQENKRISEFIAMMKNKKTGA